MLYGKINSRNRFGENIFYINTVETTVEQKSLPDAHAQIGAREVSYNRKK